MSIIFFPLNCWKRTISSISFLLRLLQIISKPQTLLFVIYQSGWDSYVKLSVNAIQVFFINYPNSYQIRCYWAPNKFNPNYWIPSVIIQLIRLIFLNLVSFIFFYSSYNPLLCVYWGCFAQISNHSFKLLYVQISISKKYTMCITYIKMRWIF